LTEEMKSYLERGHLYNLMKDFERFQGKDFRGSAYEAVLRDGT
jgi:hypothetical protein